MNTPRALALALVLVLHQGGARGAAGQEMPPAPPRDGYVALDELARRADLGVAPRRTLRERLAGLQRTLVRAVPGLRGLAPPTTGRLRLGVVLVEFADTPAPGWGPRELERALFSRGVYDRTPSGDPAYGSMADYYAENSGGALTIEGRAFDWVRLPRARADLEAALLVDPRGRALFTGALDALLARDGRGALDGLDALAFVIAGPQARRRGSVLWPHSTAFVHGGRAWRYYLMHAVDGRGRFEAIGTHCHELGHVLGLLDKYGVGARTGLGQWCAMATGAHGGRSRGLDVEAPARSTCETARELLLEQLGEARAWLGDLGLVEGRSRSRFASGGALTWPVRLRSGVPGSAAPWAMTSVRVEEAAAEHTGPRRQPPGGRSSAAAAGERRPLHLCAVCKQRLGWTRPTVIDPRQRRRLYLTAVEEDPAQVARVLLDPRGREALVLEHRRRVGFDAELPRGGLLVWRTGDPTAPLRTFVPFEALELVPAHGVRSTDAALRAPALVPFPIDGRDALVVAGRGPGAFRVRLSGIAEDASGRLYVEVGLAP